MARLFLLAFFLVLAGCMDKPESNRADDPIAEPPSGSATDRPPSNDEIPDQNMTATMETISWNSCTGLGTSLPFSNAFMLDEGETPAGWEPAGLRNDLYQIILNQCERVSVGPYERGPVSFLLEMHNAIEPPEPCREFEGGYNDVQILFSIWVDDPEIGAFLAAEYNLPVTIGELDLGIGGQAGHEVHQWTWAAEGQGSSMLAALRPAGVENNVTFTDRVFWQNGDGISLWDLKEDRRLSDTPSGASEGTLAPPMRFAKSTGMPWTGLASVSHEGEYYGPVFEFKDFECSEQQ